MLVSLSLNVHDINCVMEMSNVLSSNGLKNAKVNYTFIYLYVYSVYLYTESDQTSFLLDVLVNIYWIITVFSTLN